MDHIAVLRGIWGPQERGESEDTGPFFARVADDVVYAKSGIGVLEGKAALRNYMDNIDKTMVLGAFERPLEFLRNDDRVVVLGEESFLLKETGATALREWVWFIDFRDGLIVRILEIQDVPAPFVKPLETALHSAVERY